MTNLQKIRAAQILAAEVAATADLPPELLASVAPAVPAPEGGPALTNDQLWASWLSCPAPAEGEDDSMEARVVTFGRAVERHARAALAAQPQAAPCVVDGVLYSKAVVKRLAVQMGLIQEQQAPVALTERERVLLDGLIERELDHARQCDHIQNRKMAERQKGWDLERVAMLRKLGGIPAPQTKEPTNG